MKKLLINIERDKRYTFYATFERYSFTSGARGIQTLLLFKNIEDENFNSINGGVCFDDLKCFREINIQSGDRISFRARVLDYIEIYPDARYNCNPKRYYRLFYPTQVKKLYSPVKLLSDYTNDPIDFTNNFIIKVPVNK